MDFEKESTNINSKSKTDEFGFSEEQSDRDIETYGKQKADLTHVKKGFQPNDQKQSSSSASNNIFQRISKTVFKKRDKLTK